MLKKTLIAIAMVVLLAVPAMADPGWFVQPGIKTVCEIPVYMHVPCFFTFIDQPERIDLIQDGPDWTTDPEDPPEITFVNNCIVTLTAEIIPTGYVGADSYEIALLGSGLGWGTELSKDYDPTDDVFSPHVQPIGVKLTNVAYFDHVQEDLQVATVVVEISKTI